MVKVENEVLCDEYEDGLHMEAFGVHCSAWRWDWIGSICMTLIRMAWCLDQA